MSLQLPVNRTVDVPMDAIKLEGDLSIPPDARGIAVFVHGSGSSRHSPRNKHVAHLLQEGGLGTFLFDLLTPHEDEIRENRFDIDLLTRRIESVTYWLRRQLEVQDLPIGYFGASTGAAAAIQAAVELGVVVHAIVSRGGRPDLVASALQRLYIPTLLIVGGNDRIVMELNQEAYQQIPGEKKLVIVPGATHLFEEPGALEAAAGQASGWFKKYLRSSIPVSRL